MHRLCIASLRHHLAAAADAKYTYPVLSLWYTGPFTPTGIAFLHDKSGTFVFLPTEGDGHYYFATWRLTTPATWSPIAPRRQDNDDL